MAVRLWLMPLIPDAPPRQTPEPMSEDLRRVWSFRLPWKYDYEFYIPAPTRSVPDEVVALRTAWAATDQYQHFEVWDSEKDPVLVGVNPKPSLNGGLLGMAINGVNAVRRLLGDQSRNEYTLLAQWAEDGTDVLDGEALLLEVKRESSTWVGSVAGFMAALAVVFGVAVWIGLVRDPAGMAPWFGGTLSGLYVLLTASASRAGISAHRLLAEYGA